MPRFLRTRAPSPFIPGRRTLRFLCLDDALHEAESIAGGEVEMLGAWSLGQTLDHLARGALLALDGDAAVRGAKVRRYMAVLRKERILHHHLPLDFRWPAQTAQRLIPEGNPPAEAALQSFQLAVARLQQETQRSPHPLLGPLTREEWDLFTLRYCELYLGHALPLGAKHARPKHLPPGEA